MTKDQFMKTVAACGDNLIGDEDRDALLDALADNLAHVEVLCRVAYAHPDELADEYDNVWGGEE